MERMMVLLFFTILYTLIMPFNVVESWSTCYCSKITCDTTDQNMCGAWLPWVSDMTYHPLCSAIYVSASCIHCKYAPHLFDHMFFWLTNTQWVRHVTVFNDCTTRKRLKANTLMWGDSAAISACFQLSIADAAYFVCAWHGAKCTRKVFHQLKGPLNNLQTHATWYHACWLFWICVSCCVFCVLEQLNPRMSSYPAFWTPE